MTLLSRLFHGLGGGRAEAVPSATPATPHSFPTDAASDVSLRNDILGVRTLGFFGRAYVSPNKKWAVGCDDSNGKGTGGHREQGNGWVVLVDVERGVVVHQLRSLARPFDAAVSDTGRYAVNDTGFGLALSADAVVFDNRGTEVYRRHFEANIYSLGLSKCGRFLAVQTCNAPGSADSNLLELCDTDNGRVLFSKHPDAGWGRDYSFEVDSESVRRLTVKLPKLGSFSYDAQGVFLDHRRLLDAKLQSNELGTRLVAVQQLLETSTAAADFETALRVANELARTTTVNGGDWLAMAHRLQGEALQGLGRNAEAITAYEAALTKDAKIGVKKRLVALRKAPSAPAVSGASVSTKEKFATQLKAPR